MKALHELNSIALFCIQEYLRTGDVDYKDRRVLIQEALTELETHLAKCCETCVAYDEKMGDCKEGVRITNVSGVPATFYCKWHELKE